MNITVFLKNFDKWILVFNDILNEVFTTSLERRGFRFAPLLQLVTEMIYKAKIFTLSQSYQNNQIFIILVVVQVTGNELKVIVDSNLC